jgi:hypothetical protein
MKPATKPRPVKNPKKKKAKLADIPPLQTALTAWA